METKVLLIDDDTRVRESFTRILKIAGYNVIAAEGGEVGLKLFAQERPDLVLLDLRMPGMDGLTVLQTMRQRDPNATVILITGYGDQDAVMAALRAGASDLLLKPVDQVALARALRRVEECVHLKRELDANREELKHCKARLKMMQT